jgi:hypothetical protein
MFAFSYQLLSCQSTVAMHYGMLFVIMSSSLDEILCLNKYGEFKCKSIKDLESTDKISFRVIHLSDPTNPVSE